MEATGLGERCVPRLYGRPFSSTVAPLFKAVLWCAAPLPHPLVVSGCEHALHRKFRVGMGRGGLFFCRVGDGGQKGWGKALCCFGQYLFFGTALSAVVPLGGPECSWSSGTALVLTVCGFGLAPLS